MQAAEVGPLETIQIRCRDGSDVHQLSVAQIVGSLGGVIGLLLPFKGHKFTHAGLEISSVHAGQHLPFADDITFIHIKLLHHASPLWAHIHPADGFQLTAGRDHARQRSAFGLHGVLVQLT